MKNIFKNIGIAIMLAGLLLTSCTDQFDSMNTNPAEVTPEQMKQDNLNIGAFFTQMEKGVLIVGKDLGGEYQMTEMLTGDIFASYLANINNYGYTTYHNDHYALYRDWYNAPFKGAYVNIMQPWKSIVERTDESSPARAMATIVKVAGMHRITDMYGPIPYSKFGTDIKVAYDSQKDVYYQFFQELDDAITALTDYNDRSGAAYMARYDFIYNGNVGLWIKFANTLRLRLAMRISYVEQAKATEEATAAIGHKGGLIMDASDAAVLHQSTNLSYVNPIWEVCESFKDMRMSATMDCYLNGLNDPRRAAFFLAAPDNGYHGVRNGMSKIEKDKYANATSSVNIGEGDDLTWMCGAEAWFLMAEAKLRLGLGSETVRHYYEQGIRTSFAEWGCGSVQAYLENDEAKPLEKFKDAVKNSETTVKKMLSNLTVAWDEDASEDVKMERIMTQKWIALFPNGQEAWSEMRRTGYPGFVTILEDKSGGDVPAGNIICRLKFPTTEYSDNSANTQAAVAMLGGSDIAGTRLWWDVKRTIKTDTGGDDDDDDDGDDWDWGDDDDWDL